MIFPINYDKGSKRQPKSLFFADGTNEAKIRVLWFQLNPINSQPILTKEIARGREVTKTEWAEVWKFLWFDVGLLNCWGHLGWAGCPSQLIDSSGAPPAMTPPAPTTHYNTNTQTYKYNKYTNTNTQLMITAGCPLPLYSLRKQTHFEKLFCHIMCTYSNLVLIATLLVNTQSVFFWARV